MGGQAQGGGFQRQKTLKRRGLFAVAVTAAGRWQHEQSGTLHAQQRHLTTHLLKATLGSKPAELLADLPRELTAPGVAFGNEGSDALQFVRTEGPAAEARRSAGFRCAHGARARASLTGALGGGASSTPAASGPIKFHGSQGSRCCGALDPLSAQASR